MFFFRFPLFFLWLDRIRNAQSISREDIFGAAPLNGSPACSPHRWPTRRDVERVYMPTYEHGIDHFQHGRKKSIRANKGRGKRTLSRSLTTRSPLKRKIEKKKKLSLLLRRRVRDGDELHAAEARTYVERVIRDWLRMLPFGTLQKNSLVFLGTWCFFGSCNGRHRERHRTRSGLSSSIFPSWLKPLF